MSLQPRVVTAVIAASIAGLLGSPISAASTHVAPSDPQGIVAPVLTDSFAAPNDEAAPADDALPADDAVSADDAVPAEGAVPTDEPVPADTVPVDVAELPTVEVDTAYLRPGQSAQITAAFRNIERTSDASINAPTGTRITEVPKGWASTATGMSGSVRLDTTVTFTVTANATAPSGSLFGTVFLGTERASEWAVVVQFRPGSLTSVRQTGEPSIIPSGTGRIGVTLDNSANTDITTNARLTFIAPEAATFTESRVWYGPGRYFDGLLSSDRTRLMLDLTAFTIGTNGRMTLEVAILAPSTPTHAGVHAGGSLVFDSGSLLPAGTSVPVQYRIPSQVAAPVQVDRPELRSGETGALSVKLDNTLGFAINGTAEMTFTAPAESTFANAQYTWHLDGASGTKDGRLSADKRTLTVSTDGFGLPARKTMHLSVDIVADTVAGEGERAGGSLRFTNDVVVATGTVVPLAYDRVSTEVQIRPLVVKEPAIGGEFAVGANGRARPVFSGTATPGATISIKTAWQNDQGSTVADPVTGRWSITWKDALLPAEYSGGYTTQTFRDGFVDRVGYRFSVVKNEAIRPLIVTSPTVGGTIPVGPDGDVAPVFSGTASPGATISITTAWQESVGSTMADPISGAWSITWNKSLRPGTYVGGKTTQVLDGVRLDSVDYDFTVVR